MRKIKFRAWDRIENQFYTDYGLYLELSESTVYQNGYDGMEDDAIGQYILSQYTGLRDKNGKEIYEGDIVRYPDSTGEIYTEAVEWKIGPDSESYFSSGFRIGSLGFGEDVSEDVEVVGNIYETPALLHML